MAMAGLYRRALPSPPAIEFASPDGKDRNWPFFTIGGYHSGRDLAPILDVARFKYPPHWVPLALLWEAMDTIDAATGHPRGYMHISRLEKAPALLYTLNCRHENWVNIARYFMDEVPLLLKLRGLNNVPEILSHILQHLPSNVEDFITWVVEVRRQEENGSNLSEEEKGRLVVKEKVLQQVHDTELFKVITKLMSSASTCCRNIPSFRAKDSLTEIAASICCQGAELLSRNYGASKRFHCRGTNVKCLRADGEILVTIVSGAVVSGGNEQGIDILIPASSTDSTFCSCSDHCIVFHPASNGLATVLLLALPTGTWSGIRDKRLRDELHALVSMDNFPNVLQEEILHLRLQLHFLKRCKDNEVDDSLGLPSA